MSEQECAQQTNQGAIWNLQAKVYRRIARSIKTAKQMALAPIDTRPQTAPQGSPRQPRPPRGSFPPQGGQQRGASGYSAAAAPPSALPTAGETAI